MNTEETPKGNMRGRNRVPRGNWQPKFLEHYAKCGNVTVAAAACGIARETVYTAKLRSKRFAQQVAAAAQESLERLEAEALRRAQIGTDEPVWMKDENGKPVKVDVVKKYSDTLLIFLLKALNPQKYRETVRQELSGPGGLPIQTTQVQVNLAAIRSRVEAVVEGEERVKALIERGIMRAPGEFGGNGGNGHHDGGNGTPSGPAGGG